VVLAGRYGTSGMAGFGFSSGFEHFWIMS
jgi:hypothetical protein